MLLKWVFTILSILWLIQALRPYFEPQPPPPRPKPDPRTHESPAPDPEDDSEYIDYEEIK